MAGKDMEKNLAADLALPEDHERTGAERRLATRYELAKPVSVHVAGQGTGRLVDISPNGGIFVESPNPLPFKTEVEVQVPTKSGLVARFTGRVVRINDRGMAMHLRCSGKGKKLLVSLMEETLDPDAKPGLWRVERCLEPERAEDLAQLGAEWFVLRTEGGGPEAHQAFIDRAMKLKELSFALESYRAWKAEVPDNPVADHHLAHIAKIIGFYAFDRGARPAVSADKKRKNMMILLIILGLALLAGVGAVVSPMLLRGR